MALLYDVDFLLQLQLGVTAAMFGIIWIVQLVLYPAFADIEEHRWLAFHKMHTDRITWVVGPLMCGELAVSLALALVAAGSLSGIGLLLTLGLWAHTFFRSVPLHLRLSLSRDPSARLELVRTLVRHNWTRSALWTGRLVIAVLMLLDP